MKKLLLDLDVLLDTRLSTLGLIAPDAVELILMDDYHKRIQDDWSDYGVSVDAFIEAYGDRGNNPTILTTSRMTGIIPVVLETLKELRKMYAMSPDVDGVEVVVNTFPYTFDTEVKEALLSTLAYRLGYDATYRVVSMSPESLTPGYLNDHYESWFTYNINDWLSQHQTELVDKPIPQFTIVAPALHWNTLPTETFYVDEARSKAISGFAELELILSDFVQLHLNDVALFSVIKS